MRIFRLVLLPTTCAVLLLSTHFLEAQELPAKVKATKKLERGPEETGFRWRLGTGFGVFQDIQVPVNEMEGVRADGKTAGEENVDHGGFALSGGFGAVWGEIRGLSFTTDADFLMMRASTGPAETQSSSYTRMDAGSGARFAFASVAGFQPSVFGEGHIRRSSFNNVSNAHYLNAAIVRGGFGLLGESSSLDVWGGMAPYTEFGYSPDRTFGGKRFESSKSSLYEMGLQFAYHLGDGVWLETALAQERINVTIDDVGDYEGFGLQVEPTRFQTRAYDLSTSTARIGFRRQF